MVSWKNGDRTFFPCDDLPQHFPAIKTPFPEIAAFDPAAIPARLDFIPVSQGLNFFFDREHLYDIFDIILEKAGSSYSIHGEVTSPFDYFLSLFGHEQALLSLIDEPARAKEILQRYTEGVKKIALGIAAKGVDAIKVSSPFAGAGFISPQFYREFVLPYESEIAKAVRARGVPVYLHTCGAINDRLEMMAEAGFSGIECLDPPPLGNVLLEDAKMRVGDKIFIKGNLDPVNELLAGTPESVWEAAARRIEVGKPGGGYILSTACSIAPHTRRENIRVLARVAAQLGS
jgi:MtaA/CmuA family methyltransferase